MLPVMKVGVSIRYEHKDGGSNGMEVLRAWYKNGTWTFPDAGERVWGKMSNYQITARIKRDYWIDGTIDGFRFQAKVFDVGSKYGIDGSRVSKLFVWDAVISFSSCIISYDRGWDVKPKNCEQREILQALLEYLEALPVSKF